MPRFYVEGLALIPGSQLALPENVTRHVQVLRLKVGDTLQLFNGEGGEFSARISDVGKKSVDVAIEKYDAVNRESPLQITVVQALSATERMDYTIQKATELGVTAIQIVTSDYCAYKLAADRAEKRLAHWRAISISAAEQCGRNRLPTISGPCRFDYWLSTASTADLRLLLSPDEGIAFAALPESAQNVVVLIGPEGGFSETEERRAKELGYVALRLGPRILRTETVAPVIASLLQARYGDFG